MQFIVILIEGNKGKKYSYSYLANDDREGKIRSPNIKRKEKAYHHVCARTPKKDAEAMSPELAETETKMLWVWVYAVCAVKCVQVRAGEDKVPRPAAVGISDAKLGTALFQSSSLRASKQASTQKTSSGHSNFSATLATEAFFEWRMSLTVSTCRVLDPVFDTSTAGPLSEM